MKKAVMIFMVVAAMSVSVKATAPDFDVNDPRFIFPKSNLLIRYDFNAWDPSQGIYVTNYGTLGSVADLVARANPLVFRTTGALGAPTDQYADNSDSTFGGAGRLLTNAALGDLGGLESFTVAFWYFTPEPNIYGGTTYETFFVDNDNHSSSGFSVRAHPSQPRINLYVDGYQYTGPTGTNTWPGGGRWVFVAITWDGSDPMQPAKFYQGRNFWYSPPSLVATVELDENTQNLFKTGYPTERFGVLNRAGDNRAFDGRIDDVAVWGAYSGNGGVLTLEQIKSYWEFTFKNCQFYHNWGLAPISDIAGPTQYLDCKVNLYDLSKMASEWLDNCVDVNSVLCN